MKKQITAFYVETLLLIAVFIAVTLVLTQVFGAAKVRSTDAKILTNSVCLAQNAAEAFSASESIDELGTILGGEVNSSSVTASYNTDMTPDPDGTLIVTVDWNPEDTDAGTLVAGKITVTRRDTGDTVYTLDTAVYLQEAE